MAERIVAAIERRWSNGAMWEGICCFPALPDAAFGEFLAAASNGRVYKPRGLPRDLSMDLWALRHWRAHPPVKERSGDSWLSRDEVRKLTRLFVEEEKRESEVAACIVRFMEASEEGETGAQTRLVVWTETV